MDSTWGEWPVSEDLDLFPSDTPPESSPRGAGGPPPSGMSAPLAARMRPTTLDGFRGQADLLGEGKPIRRMIEEGRVSSMILWGPPGSGKTTLAQLVASAVDATFVAFSAVTEGIPRVREIIREAGTRLQATGRRTILFCDEIHRFNRAQQDAFLPHVEAGTVVLIGATTENPSFEIVRPLLSRAPVYVLQPLDVVSIESILAEALTDQDRGLGMPRESAQEEALHLMAVAADGDARRALGILEAAVRLAGRGAGIGVDTAKAAIQHRYAVYDKSGEEHFNLISALHKSIRGGDPDGALYWLARMLDGGEDPLYLARRLVRMASEDIGLADPAALGVAIAGREAFRFLGSPEGELALAEVAVYLAAAPKSVAVYRAWKEARSAARESPAAPVPLHLRNAPTSMMRDLGYGEGYRYDPDEPGGVGAQRYLPDSLPDSRFFRPGDAGAEAGVRERLDRWRALRGGSESGG